MCFVVTPFVISILMFFIDTSDITEERPKHPGAGNFLLVSFGLHQLGERNVLQPGQGVCSSVHSEVCTSPGRWRVCALLILAPIARLSCEFRLIVLFAPLGLCLLLGAPGG